MDQRTSAGSVYQIFRQDTREERCVEKAENQKDRLAESQRVYLY